MPLYMIMFPFLTIAAYYAVATIPDLPNKDFAFLAIAVNTLPEWVIGLIAGGGALTAILVMAISALCVGGLFSKNILGVIKPGMKQKTMTNWTRVATAVFLIFGMLTALYFPALMANVITLAYGGLTQTFIAVIFGFFWKRATKWGVGAGIIAGVVALAMIKNMMAVPWLGFNFGFWALLINLAVAVIVSLLTKPDAVAMKRFEAFRAAKPNQAK
jgi:SSS family solute:Na+ symporter